MNDDDFGSLTYGEQASYTPVSTPSYPTFSTPSYPTYIHSQEESNYDPHFASSSSLPNLQHQQEEVQQVKRKREGSNGLVIQVTNPEKHGEGSVDAYISYEVISTSKGRENKVRRRYQDFDWLKKEMDREYCFSIVPPLPEKHRTEYLDRFDPVFIEKRRKALQRFMDRLAEHPYLSNSELFIQFLEAKPSLFETFKLSRKASTMEELSDSLLSAFSRIKFPDSKFTSIAEYNQKLFEHLSNLEKIHLRMSKRQADMGEDLTNLGAVMNQLSEDERIGNAFHKLGQVHDRLALNLNELNEKTDQEFLNQLRDYILYSESIKRALKERDGEQITHEELVSGLEAKLSERESLPNPNQPQNKTWYSSLTASDPAKLQATIEELQKAVDESSEQSKKVSQLLIDEMNHFSKFKNADFKNILRGYASDRLTFAQQALDQWQALLPTIEEIKIE